MKQYFCVGTYTEPILFGTGEILQGKGKGVYLCSFDGQSVTTHQCLEMMNPSFLCINERDRLVYAVNEGKEFQGQFGGGVSEAAYTAQGFTTLNAAYPTGGTDPCHILTSPDKSILGIANFASGALTVFPLDAQGHIAQPRQLFQHEGSSVHPKRQQGPHAHSIIFADEDKLLVPDLGKDQVVAYRYAGGKAEPASALSAALPAGSGPRYGEFAPNGKHFYLINELSSTVAHFLREGDTLQLQQVISTLPEAFTGASTCADLHITPDGQYLYASNRGHDSLAIYRISPDDGALSLLGHYPTGGRTPRAFTIDPTGQYVYIGNQDSDNLVIGRILPDGMVETVCTVPFPTPVCIQFFTESDFAF